MNVSRVRALRGPNRWSRCTAIEAIVACKQDRPVTRNALDLPACIARLQPAFPEISHLASAYPENQHLTMAHVLETIALSLQKQVASPVSFSCTVPVAEEPDTYQVVVEYSEEDTGRLALEIATECCLAAMNDTRFDLTAALSRLRELSEDIRPGPSTRSIINAAMARNIPCRRLTAGSLVQLGWGSRQQRIQAAETGSTSAIAESIAQDKELTRVLLQAAGIPVPTGRPVSGVEDAWAAACEIAAPVVVKPQDGNQGKGVTANLASRAAVEAAYRVAAQFSDRVVVERFIPGNDYRMLVIGNRLVAAARRDPPQLTGDGIHTVRQLVEQINASQDRGEGHATSLTRICLDDIAIGCLSSCGLTPDSIPARGRQVILRNNANLSTGGTATDVTDAVHPALTACAINAAQMVNLDICGIDIICEDVSLDPDVQHCAVVEVNAAPGLRMHLQPSSGQPRAVGEAIIASMFADHDNARIPVVAVAGTNGKTTTTRLIASILQQQGLRTGMTCTDGAFVGNQRIDTGDCSGPKSAGNILLHPDVDAAVFETARGGILREGLGFDYCQVAVVTNIGQGDHLGLSYIHTADDLAAVKRVIVQNVMPVTGTAVLNAADPLVAAMADSCPGSTLFFSRHPCPVITRLRLQQKRVIYLDGNTIVAAGDGIEHRIPLCEIPVTCNGTIGFQIENVMAAIGATWSLNLDWHIIRAGLAGFVSDVETAPGRFNLFEYRGARLIADYGHNPDAIQALVSAVNSMPASRRSVVISGAGDRRDADLCQQTEILGDAFDEVVLYQDQCQRGRSDGEVINLLRQGLTNAKRTREIKEIRGEFTAIDTALASLHANDLCLILIDQVEAALAHITRRVAEG